MKLHFQEWKIAEGTQRIVFLHGMGGTARLWRPIAASLEDFDVLALDQRGHGQSQEIPENEFGFSPLEYGKDVVETLEQLDFHPTWIVGHSMGVRTACAAGHLKPELFKGFVLIDLGFSGPAGGGLNRNLASFLSILPDAFPSREAAKKFMMEKTPDPAIAQYLIAVLSIAADGSVSFPFRREALLDTLRDAHGVDLRPWITELGQAGKPILVLRGARSGVWTHEEFLAEQERFRSLPGLRFEEIEGAGHGLPFEKRAEFVALLRDFVATSGRK